MKKLNIFPSYLELYKKDVSRGGNSTISIYIDKRTKKKYIVKELYYKKDIKQYQNINYLKKDCKDKFICSYGIFKYKRKYFLVMDYLQGYIPLDKTTYILSKKKRFVISKKIFENILFLHEKNITHNDLKPNNIMVHPETLDVRIIDFGSSTIFHSEKEKFSPIDIGYTEGYITINPFLYYSKDEFIKNDIDNLLSFLYIYIYHKKGNKKEIKNFKKEII